MSADPPIRLLAVDADAAATAALAGAGFEVTAGALADASDHDAVLLGAADAAALQALGGRLDLPPAAFDCAVVVLTAEMHADHEAALLRMGVEAVVPHGDDLARAVAHAVVRKQVEKSARTAYATDLATGLPHQAQLLEHMTQLLALREREPAPMVLLVLRVDGFAAAAARLGAEAGDILRRKVAVRLRGGLRASDVVAAIGPDTFGVLLGHVDALEDGERVARKLAATLNAPLQVAGQPCRVAANTGLALYPEHGKDAASLLQRASAQAGSVATLGHEGFATATQRVVGAAGGAAANDS